MEDAIELLGLLPLRHYGLASMLCFLESFVFVAKIFQKASAIEIASFEGTSRSSICGLKRALEASMR